MLYTGITLAKRQHAGAYNVKIVVDASSPGETLEVSNSFLRARNATARFNPALAIYRPFEGPDQFNCSASHPSIAIIDSLNK